MKTPPIDGENFIVRQRQNFELCHFGEIWRKKFELVEIQVNPGKVYHGQKKVRWKRFDPIRREENRAHRIQRIKRSQFG